MMPPQRVCRGCGKLYAAYLHEPARLYCGRCAYEVRALEMMAVAPEWPWFVSWGCIAVACVLALVVLL